MAAKTASVKAGRWVAAQAGRGSHDRGGARGRKHGRQDPDPEGAGQRALLGIQAVDELGQGDRKSAAHADRQNGDDEADRNGEKGQLKQLVHGRQFAGERDGQSQQQPEGHQPEECRQAE
jgi:hypothetical protein